MMRFYLFAIAISFTSCLKASAQYVNDHSIDSISIAAPKIFINANNNIEWTGFPAYSDDRKTILLIHQDYSCCLSYEIKFIEMKVADLKTNKEIILVPNEELLPFSSYENEKIIDSVSNILERNSYHSMKAVDFVATKTKALSLKYNINFKLNETSLENIEVQLPKLMLAASCCNGGLPDKRNLCDAIPSIEKVWIMPKMMLVEYGILHPGNGCDKGPEYRTVKISR